MTSKITTNKAKIMRFSYMNVGLFALIRSKQAVLVKVSNYKKSTMNIFLF